MKTLLLSAAVIGGLLFQEAATAQTPATTTTTAKPVATTAWTPLNVPAMTKDLALDEKAVIAVTALNDSYNKQYAALGDRGTTDQVGALAKRRDAELQKTITAEQYAKWLKVRDAEAAAATPQLKAAKKAAPKKK